MHHVPPPFNALPLLRLIHDHVTTGAPLEQAGHRSAALRLSSSDIKKKSKVAQFAMLPRLMNFAYVADEFRLCGLSQSWRAQVAQFAMLRKQAACEARTTEAQVASLTRLHGDVVERLDKLASATAQCSRSLASLREQLPPGRAQARWSKMDALGSPAPSLGSSATRQGSGKQLLAGASAGGVVSVRRAHSAK